MSFSLQHELMVFYWSLGDDKCSQVSRTFPSILADLNNAVVWIVSIRPPISNSSGTLSKPLETVPNALIRIDITVIFHSFLSYLVRSEKLSH